MKTENNNKKAVNKTAVSDSIFTNDELIIIRTDILKLYATTEMDEWEVHKRNLMLNKIRAVIGG